MKENIMEQKEKLKTRRKINEERIRGRQNIIMKEERKHERKTKEKQE